LFVLRDFNDRGDNKEKTKAALDLDVNKLWSELYKPEKFKDKAFNEFFDTEYIFMPHKVYCED